MSPSLTTNMLSIVPSSTLPPLLLFVLILRPSYSSPGREIDELTTELMASSMVTTLAESSSVAMATSTVDSHQQSERSSAPITPTSVRHWLSVTLVRVETESVLLEWSCSPAVRQQLVTCQARYGILTPEKTILQIWQLANRWFLADIHHDSDRPSIRIGTLNWILSNGLNHDATKLPPTASS